MTYSPLFANSLEKVRDNGSVVREKKDGITISVNTKKDTIIMDVVDRYFDKLSLRFIHFFSPTLSKKKWEICPYVGDRVFQLLSLFHERE